MSDAEACAITGLSVFRPSESIGTRFKDITGKRSGMLTIVSRAYPRVQPRGDKRHRWNCKCDCGASVIVDAAHLNGRTTSCGCRWWNSIHEAGVIHGQARVGKTTSEFVIWCAMIDRCRNSNNKDFKHYGGRGISVCGRWVKSFANFFSDMGPRPQGLSIDRKDNDGNYEPGNCRWATRSEQNRNKRSKLKI